MTSQVAVFNQLGIGLASDTYLSVTSSSSSRRVYENRSKIVPLGDSHQLAGVFSGPVEVNDVDVSVLFREWRRTLANPLETVDDYAMSFRSWLEHDDQLISDLSHTNLMNYMVIQQLFSLKDAVDRARDNATSVRAVNKNPLLKHVIEMRLRLTGLPVFEGVTAAKSNLLVKGSRIDLERLASGVFPTGRDHLDEDLASAMSELSKLLPEMVARVDPTLDHTTVALAGFGTKDNFPSIVEISLFGRIGKEVLLSTQEASHGRRGVKSFAQDDAVNGFLWGVSMHALETIQNSMFELIEDKRALSDLKEHVEDRWTSIIVDRLATNFYEPILDSVESLSLSDLARLARSLVEIEALRANASPNPPGVGGLIETLVIDRYDGVRWLRRLD